MSGTAPPWYPKLISLTSAGPHAPAVAPGEEGPDKRSDQPKNGDECQLLGGNENYAQCSGGWKREPARPGSRESRPAGTGSSVNGKTGRAAKTAAVSE